MLLLKAAAAQVKRAMFAVNAAATILVSAVTV
jgi:hypothetical protein